MRKVSYIFFIMLVTAGLLSGCARKDSPDPEANLTSAPAMTQSLKQALKLSDAELVEKYCSGIDLVLADNLLFAQAKDIPAETLYIFFCYITGSPEGSENIQEKWYNKTDDKYHVPVADIEEVLNRYFDGVVFDPTEIEEVNNETGAYLHYDTKTKEFIASGLGGFGGGRFPKLAAKEQLSDDTLKLTVDYYDPEYKNVFYTKAYTIRFTEEGYQYLSIKMVV